MDRVRCFGSGDPLYEQYHDREWGRALADTPDEAGMFERLVLEGFLAGLSWLTILRKREAFRRAFSGFEPHLVAGYGEADVARLLGDAGIVRNRRKIEAAIGNARALVALHGEGLSLAGQLNAHLPPPRPERAATLAELPAQTVGSVAASAELKRHGFSFVGPVTIYAMWQATGMVDDHLADCWLVTGGLLPKRPAEHPAAGPDERRRQPAGDREADGGRGAGDP